MDNLYRRKVVNRTKVDNHFCLDSSADAVFNFRLFCKRPVAGEGLRAEPLLFQDVPLFVFEG